MGERWAEVVERWGDEIVDVRHVRAAEARSLVREQDGELVCVVPEGARAFLVRRGPYRSRTSETPPALDGGRRFVLPHDASARIEVGALTYEVRHAEAPAKLARGSRTPPLWLAVSFALHGVLVVMLWMAPPRLAPIASPPIAAPAPSIELAPERAIGIDAIGGTGARHADEDGAMGAPEVRVRDDRYAVPAAADPALARRRARALAVSAGVLGVLNAGAWSAPASPYGAERAGGSDPMAALGALMGDQMGPSFGHGGLGMRGTGRGAGGRGRGTIGLGALGTIGHGSGCRGPRCEHGSGYGRGAGGLPDRVARSPIVHCNRRCQTEVRGALSRHAIRRVVQRRLGEVRFCYEQGLQHEPTLAGRVEVRWIIGADGRVTSAEVASSTLGSATVDACVVQAVRRWSFPRASSPTGVRYPFVLRSA